MSRAAARPSKISRSAQQADDAASSSISIGKLAEDVGISTATINFYVTENVIPPPRKINRTRAAYNDRHVRLLRLVKAMQSQGYSLAQVKQAFDRFGRDEKGLKKLEGVGRYQPLPAPRNHPVQKAIDHFAPVDRAAFLKLANDDVALVDMLEKWGLLRPRLNGKFDARDLYLVRTMQSIHNDGIPVEKMKMLASTVAYARDIAPLLMLSLEGNRARLMTREIRVRDVCQTYIDVLGYVMDRILDEQNPTWRDSVIA